MSKGTLLAVSHTGLVAGAEHVLLRLLAAAADRGWRVAAAIPEGPLDQRLSKLGVDPVRIPHLMLPAGAPPVALARLSARTALAARELRHHALGADVIVAAGVRALPALRLARPRAPVVWLAQSVVGSARWQRVLRACEGVVTVAVAVSGAVAESLGPTRFPVELVWNGTPWPVAPARREPPDPPVIGCAAVLTPWKGQDVLLEAAARLEHRGVVVELLGEGFPKDGAYVARLHRRAARPDLDGRVRFVGRVEDCLPYMRQWSLAVVASVEPEAGPLAALEAMSVGVPVVASDHGGPAEILRGAGLLVPPGDPDALATAIETVLDDPDARRRFGTAGRRVIAENHALDRQIARMVGVVERAAGVPVTADSAG